VGAGGGGREGGWGQGEGGWGQGEAPAKTLPGNSHKEPEITPEPKLELKKA
jgi:hypothetical protein